MKKRNTYKKQMTFYSFITIVILLAVMIFHFGINQTLFNKYNNSYLLYDKLNDFYEVQSKTHESLKNYLYTKSDKAYQSYKELCEQGKTDIVDIQRSLQNEEVIQQFQLLYNMKESYNEQANKVILLMKIGDREYGNAYENLLKINETVLQTSDDYYRQVTSVMKKTLNEIAELRRQVILISLLLISVCITGIIVYTLMILKSITNPIDELVNNIDGIKAGTFRFNSIPSDSDEIKVLRNVLQDLSDAIHENAKYEKEKALLENKLLLNENENLRKDELLATSELKMLQNQLNPHFLFNAMNMIYQQAIMEHSKVTVIMIEKMTECIRYTLSQKNRTSSLRPELIFVENYIYIQNKRFEGRIHFELSVEENVPNIKIPAMIVEPLIDNSIKHGFRDTISDGLVTISISYDTEHVYIQVSDNGKGMDTNELEKMELNHFHIETQNDNLGLYNLSRRLHMFYYNEAILTVNSFEECGFDTMITIPITRGRNRYDKYTGS